MTYLGNDDCMRCYGVGFYGWVGGCVICPDCDGTGKTISGGMARNPNTPAMSDATGSTPNPNCRNNSKTLQQERVN